MRIGVAVDIQSIVAMCIYMHLHLDISIALLQKLGYTLGPAAEIHMMYKTLFYNCYHKNALNGALARELLRQKLESLNFGVSVF